MDSAASKKNLLDKLRSFKDYTYIGKLINSEDIWFERLEEELMLLDSEDQIDYDVKNMEDIVLETYPQVFKCSKYTYQYLDALYAVLIEGILKDYLLQTVNADFLEIQDKINEYKLQIQNLKRPINEREKERIGYWKKMLISKKIDFHIVEALIETFEVKFAEVVERNQENDVLLERLVQLREKRLSMIHALEAETSMVSEAEEN